MPKYVSQNLMADEKIVYQTKLHWILYFKALVVVLFGVFMIFLLPLVAEGLIATPGMVVIVIGILYGIYLYFLINSSECVITNKRVIFKKGIISTTTVELLHSKIETISVYQSISGKVFGYGNLNLIGSGGTQNIFYSIERPFEFKKAAQEEIDRVQKTQK